MSNITMNERQSLTRSQTRDIRAELARESRRLSPDDPRAHAFTAAMHRIDHGMYGFCATCGDGISHERLSVMPETIYCVTCRRENA